MNTISHPKREVQLLCYLIAFSVFSKELFDVRLGSSQIDAFQISLAGFGILAYGIQSRFAIQVGFAWALIIVCSFGLLNYFGYDTRTLLWQGLPLAATYVGFAGILTRIHPGMLVHAYRNVSFWVAGFGLIQFALSLGGIQIMMKTVGRLDSITYEPSHYAIAIGPAVYLSLQTILREKKFFSIKDLTIVASIIATISLTGFVILIFCVGLLSLRKKGGLPIVAVAVCGSYLFMNPEVLPKEVADRIEAIQEATGGDASAFEITNLSVFSALTNLEVAFNTLQSGRLLGNGFGGHASAFSEYVSTKGLFLGYREDFNAVAGHSLFIRILSEFGPIGILIYLGWLFKGINAAGRPEQIWWTLSAIFFFGRIFKLGGYFEIGTPIFILAPLVFYGRHASMAYQSRRHRGMGVSRDHPRSIRPS